MTGRPRLGFIGIGLMGEAMTLRLLERGWPVTVWNLTEDRYARVVPSGAVRAATPAAVAARSDLVLMCVLDAGAVRNCVFGEHGLASAPRGTAR
jgi:3-hydroxyisobutyrate dehydrogenase